MGFKDSFKGFSKPDNIIHTPYGDFHLAKGDKKRVQKMIIDLQRATDALTRQDMQDWRQAWQMAINVDSPNRQRIYDIYRDAMIDLHLSGCIEQRKGFVMSRSFKLVDTAGNENEEARHYLEQSWFKQLLKYALDSIYWGHSLIELGDITTDGDGCVCYDGVKLIPRKHVIPEYGRVVSDLGQDWTSGIEYRQPPYSDWLIEAGLSDDLGLLLKAATQTIPKKNMLAFWDTFGEIFGMPMRCFPQCFGNTNGAKQRHTHGTKETHGPVNHCQHHNISETSQQKDEACHDFRSASADCSFFFIFHVLPPPVFSVPDTVPHNRRLPASILREFRTLLLRPTP